MPGEQLNVSAQLLTSCTDNDSNNQPINTQHSSHDHWHNRLHHQLWSHHTHRSNAYTGLGCPISGAKACKLRKVLFDGVSAGLARRKGFDNVRDRSQRARHLVCWKLSEQKDNQQRPPALLKELCRQDLHANTRAAAAPIKPKKGPTTSPAPLSANKCL